MIVCAKIWVFICFVLSFFFWKVTASTVTPSIAPTEAPTSYPSLSPHSISIITTIAGTGVNSYSGDGGAATDATLNSAFGIVLDSIGNVYFSDSSNNRVRKITVLTGIISTYAGTGSGSYSGDGGVASSAELNYPQGLCMDSSGNLHISDRLNNRIRKVAASTSIMSTIAGTGSFSYGGDNGQATSASLKYPVGVAVDTSGNIYIGDNQNNRVRKVIALTSVISTIAGTGTPGYSGNGGQATAANIQYPHGINLDSSLNVYFGTCCAYNVIRKVTISTGIISTVAGTGSATGSYNGDNIQATAATLYYPHDVFLDSYDNLYVCDSYNHRVRKVDVSTGLITTLVGTGTASSTGDGAVATSANVNTPVFSRLDTAGNLYITESIGNRVRKVVTVTTDVPTYTPSVAPSATPTYIPSTAGPSVTPTYYPSLSPSTIDIITTIAGTGASSYSGDGGAATSAALTPYGIAIDTSDNLYIGDWYNNRVIKITAATGIITSIAGTGVFGYSGNGGAATSATLKNPDGIALDTAVSTGVITTFAGTGSQGYSGDGGLATSAKLSYPHGVVVDNSGNVYIADQDNSRIRKVTISTGIITTFAGTGISTYSGDGGPASSAALSNPYDLVLDASGNVYISDTKNNRIRKVTLSTNIITTVAGAGSTGYSGDGGQATSALLYSPIGIELDQLGNLYVADVGNYRIRKITLSTGIIVTIAGTGTQGYSGDGGLATSAVLNSPWGVTVDASGNVYFADCNNWRIRKVTLGGTYGPTPAPTSPSPAPSVTPTVAPTSTRAPSSKPSYFPSVTPSLEPTELPSENPTVTPTTKEPSYEPSLAPSMVPSYTPTTTYPTYITSVAVYFHVEQVVAGISSSQYESNKNSNDEVLKQTIARMVAYDVHSNDVSDIITTTTGSSIEGMVSSNTMTLTLLYSISKNSYIFNDIDQATVAFIAALNDSIIAGTFDNHLHINSAANGNNDLQSIVTVHATFTTAAPSSSPTAAPSSSPTAVPTLQPTHQDMVEANILGTTLDARVAKAKVQYYLGTFVGYFFGIYILLYLYSFTGAGKAVAKTLYDSSFKAHLNYCENTDDTASILRDLQEKNILVSKMMKLEGTIRLVRQSRQKKEGLSNDDSSSGKQRSLYSIWSDKLLGNVFKMDEEEKYSRGYREYMQQERTLLGCSPLLYPDGCTIRLPFFDPIVLPPGRLEDCMLYLCHNHPLLSCFYFMEGSKLGAHGTRILYVGKNIMVFVMYQFSNLLLQYYTLDGHGLAFVINMLLITPSAAFIRLILKYLYICPFMETVEFQQRYAQYQSIIMLFGRLGIVPIMLIMCSALIIACLFSSGRRIPLIIINFFVFVQFYGVVLGIATAILLFFDGYYLRVSLLGVIDILRVGALFKERIMAEGLVADVNYAYRVNHYLNGLIIVQKILNRDDAIKAKWMIPNNDVAVDIEIPITSNTENSLVDEEDFSYTVYETVNKKEPSDEDAGALLPIAGLVNDMFFKKAELDPINTHVFSSTTAVTKNPLHHSNPSKNTWSSSESLAATEDEESLYQEYRNQCACSSNSDEVYASNDEVLSFEEWKIKRKEFKKGTRGSFIRAFQVFEERELHQADSEPMGSTKHAMRLYGANAKNALNKTGRM